MEAVWGCGHHQRRPGVCQPGSGRGLESLRISLRRIVRILCKPSGAAAFREIYKNTALRRWNAYAAEAVSLVIAGMVREVPVYEMISPPDIRAVELLRKELWSDG